MNDAGASSSKCVAVLRRTMQTDRAVLCFEDRSLWHKEGQGLAIAEEVEAPVVSFGPMESSIGFLLRIAQLTVSEATFAELNRRDVPIGEFTILLSVDLNPGIRQGVLADRLKIKWSNMTKLVRSLEERGLIVRQVPPDDRRAIALSVTDEGHARVESHKALVLGAIERSVPTLNEQEKQILLGLLRKVAGWPPL